MKTICLNDEELEEIKICLSFMRDCYIDDLEDFVESVDITWSKTIDSVLSKKITIIEDLIEKLNSPVPDDHSLN